MRGKCVRTFGMVNFYRLVTRVVETFENFVNARVMLVAGISRVLSYVPFVPSGVRYIELYCSRKTKGGKECIPKGCGLRLKASI